MGTRLIALLTAAMVSWLWVPAEAQTLGQVFKRVSASVVVVRTRETEVAARGQGQTVNVSGVGSGVLISEDGKVMTAAHLVHTADEITVEFLDGEVMEARVIASEPEADARGSYERIQERLRRLHPGAEVTITVLREGRQVELRGPLP